MKMSLFKDGDMLVILNDERWLLNYVNNLYMNI